MTDNKSKIIYFWMMFYILLMGVNYGIDGLHNFNLVELVSNKTHPYVNNLAKILLGICCILLIMKRDVYLPFLGEAVFPCGNLGEKIPNNHQLEIKVNVQPNSNVIYWASEPTKNIKINTVFDAYANYENAGIVKSNNDGLAILKIRNPQKYIVPSGKTIKEHLHYRICHGNGMLGPVKTIYV